MSGNNSTNVDLSGSNDSNFHWATVVLVTPFVVIPSTIILVRLIRYLWKIHQAKKYGYGLFIFITGDYLFEDPLAELGINLRRGFENTQEIRKIRKEQKKMMMEIEAREQKQAETKDSSRRLPDTIFLKPLLAAESYIAQVKKQTKKTWSDKLSPEAVKRWLSVSPYARMWMVLQVLVTILAIINYVALTYLINASDAQERNTIKDLDLFYSIIFLLDYALSFYIADDRLVFFFNGMSLVDLISIVSPFVYLFVLTPTKYVWFIGLIRIFRATRILRTYRLLSFSQSEETRELVTFTLNFFNFVFFSTSVINACETLVDVWDTPASLKNWHDSLYYIMVTFSTIGFGDLTPNSTYSRIIVMCLIIMVILYVPYQTGKILELYNSLSKFQRAQYSASSEHAHIILGGNMTYSSIIDFCREFFIADSTQAVVILTPEEPDLNLKRFLNHPFYRNRLEYLNGSILNLSDLNRASAKFATGLFLVNMKTTSGNQGEEDEIKETREKDANLLMQSLVAKTAFPGLPVFAQVQDSRSKDLSNHCGCDRVICGEELKASLFAANCVVPGMLALIPNLVHTFKDVDDISISEFWMTEYQCGIANQLHAFKIPSGLIGVRFADAVSVVYETYNTMIFGLITHNSGFNRHPIRIVIPKDYILRQDDIAICITEGGDETILRISIHFKDESIKNDFLRRDLEADLDKAISHIEEPTQSPLQPVRTLDSCFTEISLGSVPQDISSHIILCGNLTARTIRHFVEALRSKQESSDSMFPVVCILDNLPEITDFGIWSDILAFKGVYVCQGTAMKKTTLQRAKIDTCSRLVVFSKAELSTIPDSITVFLEWPQVQFIIELIDGSNVKYFNGKSIEWDTDNLKIQSIINNYALSVSDRLALYNKLRTDGLEKTYFMYQLISLIKGNDIQTRPQIVKKPSIKKTSQTDNYQELKDDQDENEVNHTLVTDLSKLLEKAELNESGLSPYPMYNFDKFFAAGMISTSSFLQSILCQSYFRPYILDAVQGLIDNTIHLAVKDSMDGKEYGKVAKECIQAGYIPLGLYRNGRVEPNMETRQLPFVYTNCRQNDIVSRNDLIFAIKRVAS